MNSLKLMWPVLLLALASCGPSTADLKEQATDADARKRLEAIHTLQGRVDERETVLPVLLSALKDDNLYVRRDAAKALAHFGPEARDAVPALLEQLRDREPSVRKAAAQSLKRIDPATAAKAGIQ
ncbi:MAG TPA: HEAT repeat domain-containing protein [Gemmataceae bacterium]|nr:HEAT repeat domain-containing protein [Gemmataceae bacterium]